MAPDQNPIVEAEREPTRRPSERPEPADRGPAPQRPDRQGADSKPQPKAAFWRDHPYAVGAAALAVLLVAIAGLVWWLNAREFESTDDAFIDTRTVTVMSQINGAVVEVPVTDNQHVEAGGLLVRIDERDYQAAVAQAQAQVDQAAAAIANADAQIAAQQARVEQAGREITQAQGALEFSQKEAARARELLGRGAGTEQQAQQTASDLIQKQAAFSAAQANEAAAEKQIAVLQTQKQSAVAQREQAEANLAQANANLSRTRITAPVDGRATKISAALGAVAIPGQALLMFVPDAVWVTANYKETQLNLMRPGQPVSVTVDAYPGRTFRARVDSIQAGSGAAFSLLPPENATGNYVKVVQRVPVKIVFDEPPDVHLGPGMSVVPTVRVR